MTGISWPASESERYVTALAYTFGVLSAGMSILAHDWPHVSDPIIRKRFEDNLAKYNTIASMSPGELREWVAERAAS
ncbi:hypothetical protein M8C13_18080 [Crossiella sp. SN42]|uniref:hypothetical protein n=1 Tax=Crossiella sp. SN42 TaxID=2944808 RepID=UPI00207C247C|nr:hypothetical protein [Crossiella sp. SN42]MCO1577668.1 hypothetical protein [Crossiella sp. SN42]